MPTPDVAAPAVEAAAPAAGLISAAPVGWGAPEGQAPAAGAPPSGPAAPAVGWAAPPKAVEVPGAPGLSFAGTAPRLVGYIVDLIILGIVGGFIGGLLGAGTTTIRQSADGTSASYYTNVTGAAFTVPLVILSLVYFVFFWTGGRRASPGQRIFNIQVGNAFDGRSLTLEQAVRRWAGYGIWIGLLALAPALAGTSSLIQLVWVIALLITTATSSTKQGLHDRFANTALVRPAGAGSGGLAMACLLVIGILFLIFVVSIVALIFLGGQVSTILSTVGESI